MLCKKCGMPEIPFSSPQYHYLESGLRNIFLAPAPLIICERCSTKRPEIKEPILLNLTIAESIILKPFPLVGTEISFLRKNLNYSVSSWSKLLHLTLERNFALENEEEPITPQLDLLIRLLYIRLLEETSGQTIKTNLIDKFAGIDFDNPNNFIVFINLGIPPKYYYLQPNEVAFY